MALVPPPHLPNPSSPPSSTSAFRTPPIPPAQQFSSTYHTPASTFEQSPSVNSSSPAPPQPTKPPPAPPTSISLPTTQRLSSSSFARRDPPPVLPPLPSLPSLEEAPGMYNSRTSSSSSRSNSSSVTTQSSHHGSISPQPRPISSSTSASPPPINTSGYGSAITNNARPVSTTDYSSTSPGDISSRPRNKKKLGINTATPQARNSRVVQSMYYPSSPGYSPLVPTHSHPVQAPSTPSVANPLKSSTSPLPPHRPPPPMPSMPINGMAQINPYANTGNSPRSAIQYQHQHQDHRSADYSPNAARLRPMQSQASSRTLLATVKNTLSHTNITSGMNSADFSNIHAKFIDDDDTKTKLKLLVSSEAKFDEIVEFGFPIIPDKSDYELTSQLRKASVSTTTSEGEFEGLASPIDSSYRPSSLWSRRISMVPREMTLKITLSPPAMRESEEAIYEHINDVGTIKSTKSLGMVEEDDEILPTPDFRGPMHRVDLPSQLTSSLSASAANDVRKTGVKKMFGRLKKQPKERTPNAAMIITSADLQS